MNTKISFGDTDRLKLTLLQIKGAPYTANKTILKALAAIFILTATLSPSLAAAACNPNTLTKGCPVSQEVYNRLTTSQRYQWAVNQCFADTNVTYRQAYGLIDNKSCASGTEICRVGSFDGSIQLNVLCKSTN